MAIVTGTRRTGILSRIGLYLVLGGFALLLLFPFIYLVGGSLKAREDVFSYPPQVLPREPRTADVGGEPRPLFTVDGRELALLGEEEIGRFAPPDDLDAIVEVPTGDVEPTGGYTDQQTAVVDGEEQDLFDVPVDGGVVPMVEREVFEVGRFAAPDDPEAEVLAPVEQAVAVERISGRPGNYREVLELQTLDRSLTNTLLVTTLVVAGTVFTSVLGGYAFARIRFPGRTAAFLVYIGSNMVPFVIILVPLYQLMVAVGWVDSLAALVFPFVFNAYGTFLMRQFFVSIPKELEEAAFVDGASRWTILWRIFVPLSRPAIATLATFMFLYAWNSFVWPFIVINAGNTENHVLTLSLQVLGGRAADSPNLVFAGVAIAVVVPVVVFVLLQRYFVENVATSGIK
jgi:multiple sugar transport system permease protein